MSLTFPSPATSDPRSMSSSRRRYPSDLRDPQWASLQRNFPENWRAESSRRVDLREVVNAIQYRWQTGCPWRMLPHDFPKWQTVYSYFQRWQRDGLLTLLRKQLCARGKSPGVRCAPNFPDRCDPSAR